MDDKTSPQSFGDLDDGPKKDLEAKIVILEQRVDHLEKEVANLKKITTCSVSSNASEQIHDRMEKLPIQKRRTVVFLGKVGAGKATLANTIAGNVMFKSSDAIDSMTRRVRDNNFAEKDISIDSVHYALSFLLLDTYGLQVVNQTDHINNVTSVNLILFVYKYGRYTQEENDSLTMAVNMLGEDAKRVSALIITGCEDLSGCGRQRIIKDFKTNPLTKQLANFMEKGIYTVGFPDLGSTNEEIRKGYMTTIEKDKAQLWDLVEASEESIKPQVSNPSYYIQKPFTTYCIIS